MKKKTNQPPVEFSAPRHKTIAELADGFIANTSAEKEIKKLLQKINAPNLKEIAPWADAIKPTTKEKPTDKETAVFLKTFPDTREWHFVDLPIDATAYDKNEYSAFTREDDVVQIIIECINILTGKSKKFSKPNALRWLVHLIGDIHQPLHIACSYIDYNKTKPKLVFKKEEILTSNLLQKSDRGGNKINLPIGRKGKALHSYWDSDLPQKDNNFDNLEYTPPPPVSLEKLIQLPAQWVSENLQFAKEAYKGLTVTGKNQTHPTYVDVSWDKTQYDKRCVPIIKQLSLKAATRLAYTLIILYS